MFKQLVSILIVILVVGAILFVAALIFIPQEVHQTWLQWGLPPQPLEQLQARFQPAGPGESAQVRLYGTLEARPIHVMSEVRGRAVAVLVEEGDWVEKDQVVIRLDPTDVQAQIAAAEEGLAAAQAAREAAAAGPGPETQRVAQSQVDAARAALANARRNLDYARNVWENPLTLDAQIDQTAALIPVAQAQVDAAQADIHQIDALLVDARTDGSREGKYRVRILEEQRAAAEANLAAAQARLQGLRETLKLLKQTRENPLALLAQVHQAEGGVKVAQAGLQVALAQYAAQTAAPQPEAVAVAEAQVQQAQAALDLARWQQPRLRIPAPASGQVQSRLIEPGEMVEPGQPLITLADTRTMEVWVYVPARDLHRVHLGETLPVEVLAIPGQAFQAQVFYIAPEAQFRPTNVLDPEERGDMVFLVKLRLPNEEGRLKPGMPADVLLRK